MAATGSRGGSGGGGNGQSCCRSFWSFLFATGFIVLIYWAIFQPHHIRATVGSALSNLTVSNSNNASSAAEVSVSYSLAVDLGLYNPSLRVDIYYDAVDAALRFGDAVLAPAANATSPHEFHQRRKTGDDVKLAFDYGRGVAVAADVPLFSV